jgi:flagellar hook-length control protein FliK
MPAAASGPHADASSAAAAASTTSAAQSQIQLQQPVSLSGVPVLIASRALAGDKQFEIRLDPPELGRIEVRMKVDRQGQISSHVIADRPDTLTLLRRDGAGLERALQDAGFKTAGDGLQFSLRDQRGNGQQDTRSTPQMLSADQETTTRLDPIPSGYMRYSGRVGGLDIRV